MSWLDDLANSFGFSDSSPQADDTPYGSVPNRAGAVRSEVAPALDPMRGSNDRLDKTVLTGLVPASMRSDPSMSDAADLYANMGNAQRNLINQYAPKAPSGWETIGNILKAASVPVSYYQGNRGYGQSMQDQLSREAESRRGEEDNQRKLMLQNADQTITGFGNTANALNTSYRDRRMQTQQRIAKLIQSAAIEAHSNGEDPHDAQGRVIQGLIPLLKADPATADLADAYAKAYPVSSAPPSPQGTPPAGVPPSLSPMAPNAGGQPGPTQVAANGPVALPQSQPTPPMPDFAQGLRVAAGGPQDASQIGQSSGPAPAAPTPGPAAAPQPQPNAVPRWKQYQDLSRQLLDVDPEKSKWYADQSKDLIKTRKVVDIADNDGNKHPFWVDAADPSVPPVPVQPHEMQEAAHSRAKDIADGIESGDLPPETTGLYRWGGPVKAELANRKIPLAKMQLQWKAAQAQVKGLNSDRLNRFVQLGTSVLGTMGDVENLSKEMDQGGLTGLNAIKLQALIHAEGNSPRGQLATKYLGAVNTLKEEFANLAQGGFAPTEAAWKLANDQINGNFGVKQMAASIAELKRLINYRLNAVPGLSTFGAGSANRYTGADGSRAIGSGIQAPNVSTPRPMPKVGDTVAGHVYKGGPVNDPASWEEVEGAHDNNETQESGE